MGGEVAQVIPGNRFGLSIGRCEVMATCIVAWLGQYVTYQLVDREYCLASPAVNHQYVEAVLAAQLA